jgi:heme/copper-type cytochrome/quinol oxidase subunit 2
MPIMVQAMSEPDFDAWTVQAKKEFANATPEPRSRQPDSGHMAARDDHPAGSSRPPAALLTAANEVQH